MALEDAAKNTMLDALALDVIWVSAHSAFPATGGNELAGGTPAYARKAITWNAASAGSIDSSNTPVLDIESGDTVAALGLWTLVTAGVLQGGADVTDEVFGAQGTYTVDDFDITLT